MSEYIVEIMQKNKKDKEVPIIVSRTASIRTVCSDQNSPVLGFC